MHARVNEACACVHGMCAHALLPARLSPAFSFVLEERLVLRRDVTCARVPSRLLAP